MNHTLVMDTMTTPGHARCAAALSGLGPYTAIPSRAHAGALYNLKNAGV
ncbi:MAG: hypothetical protein NC406_06020 [Bacteroides sp.]|nr:hypothetical protein [Bacteroides sp.]MCM1095560.1 hypothetical protein [Terasakiella sp.]